MALAALRPFPKFKGFDGNGNLLAGGKLYTYSAGTTSPLATYTTPAGTVANTNPVILDSNGEADVYFSPVNYKLVLKDANDNLLWTVDNYTGSPYPITDEWVTYIHTWTYVSANQVSVPGDQTAIYQENKAIRAVCTGGTFYGVITDSTYDGSTKTMLTVSFDAGLFDSGVSGTSTISVGVQSTESPGLIYANAAVASAAMAAEAAAAATSLVGAIEWVSGATYAIGDPVWSPINYLTYRRTTNGGGTTDPSLDPTNWELIYRIKMLRSSRTSNTVITAADVGKFIDITSGTFTQTFDACSTLGNGWFLYLRNSGTGDIAIDPNSGEMIDGLTSFVMYPGEARLLQCDGTQLRSILLKPGSALITTTGNFIVPPGISELSGEVISAGGGGGGGRGGAAASARPGGSGGGGGCNKPFRMRAPTAGTTVLCTIGAGGVGGNGGSSANGSNGTAGGNSSFGSYCTAYGGGAGAGGISGSDISGGGGGGFGGAGGNGSTSVAVGGYPRGAGFGSGDSLTGSTSSTVNNIGGGGAASGLATTAGSAEYGGASGGTGNGSGGGNVGGGSIFGGGGGGAGAGIPATNVPQGSPVGGVSGSYSVGGGAAGGGTDGGGAGTTGANGANGLAGGGGGGGACNTAGTGGRGGDGGTAGGGGAGGGGGTTTGGRGGDGGRGEIRIYMR